MCVAVAMILLRWLLWHIQLNLFTLTISTSKIIRTERRGLKKYHEVRIFQSRPLLHPAIQCLRVLDALVLFFSTICAYHYVTSELVSSGAGSYRSCSATTASLCVMLDSKRASPEYEP